MRCALCDAPEMDIVRGPRVVTWGGARVGTVAFQCTIDDTWSRCPSCGEEFYTARQSARHTSQIFRALYADWCHLMEEAALMRQRLLQREHTP